MPTRPAPSTKETTRSAGRRRRISRIAVGVDGYPEGRDAAALGSAVAEITAAELMLVAVDPLPLVVLPSGLDWKSLHQSSETTLHELRATVTPGARTVLETDLSVARALHRVIRRERRDLLVVGSSRRGAEGCVRIGKRTRQLLCNFECALAVAPRGLHKEAPVTITTIGVGYDGGAESEAALALADSIAASAGAQLRLRGIMDDRIPMLLRSALGGLVSVTWNDALEIERRRLQSQGTTAASSCRAAATFDLLRGRPADALLSLSQDVDLLVIGSRRWGPAARVLLGSTGEALLHDARCPVMAVQRPPH